MTSSTARPVRTKRKLAIHSYRSMFNILRSGVSQNPPEVFRSLTNNKSFKSSLERMPNDDHRKQVNRYQRKDLECFYILCKTGTHLRPVRREGWNDRCPNGCKGRNGRRNNLQGDRRL